MRILSGFIGHTISCYEMTHWLSNRIITWCNIYGCRIGIISPRRCRYFGLRIRIAIYRFTKIGRIPKCKTFGFVWWRRNYFFIGAWVSLSLTPSCVEMDYVSECKVCQNDLYCSNSGNVYLNWVRDGEWWLRINNTNFFYLQQPNLVCMEQIKQEEIYRNTGRGIRVVR